MRLNKNLVNLLKELEDRVDEADKKAIKQTLHDVCIPSVISLPESVTRLLLTLLL